MVWDVDNIQLIFAVKEDEKNKQHLNRKKKKS